MTILLRFHGYCFPVTCRRPCPSRLLQSFHPPLSYGLWSLGVEILIYHLGCGTPQSVRFTFMSSYELDAEKSVYQSFTVTHVSTKVLVYWGYSANHVYFSQFWRLTSSSSRGRQIGCQARTLCVTDSIPWWVFTWQRGEQVLSGLSSRTLDLFVRVPVLWIQYSSLKVQPPDTMALISRFHYLT